MSVLNSIIVLVFYLSHHSFNIVQASMQKKVLSIVNVVYLV